MDVDRHQMQGTQRLTYTNNSPDTLRHVFYHLYFNAFNPNSMMAERNRELPDPDGRIVPRIFELGPDEVGYHEIDALTQDGEAVTFEITDTVVRVALAEPILPGDSAVFDMRFHSQVPLQTRRSGRDSREGIDYSMTQWYPKMAAYDTRGWHAVPYVGREFYAPFGTFDVNITLPANYLIGSSGVLQNPDQIGHGYQSDADAAYTYDPSQTKTWRFRAENVHDFAWAADPDYIHEQIEGDNGTIYHLLYQPDVADSWQRMDELTPAVIEALSDVGGPYPWPQFTVIQGGDGGMEYPMITLITGRRSPGSVLGVTAHEAGHMWYYGVLGFNETDYAWLDEGFASYASGRAMAQVLGQPMPSFQGNAFSIVNLQKAGIGDRLSTPADWFETNAAYGTAAYSGGAMIADMLGYVMGDEVRDRWLHELFRRYKFKHPNPADVEKVAEDVSGMQLDWFFEEFTNTTRTLDYAVGDLDSRSGATTITLHRKAPNVVPIDLRLTLEDGSTQWVNIPVGEMQGHKPVSDDWIVAEPWLWTFPEYTLSLDLPQRVVKAEIDPLNRTPDVNRLNNASSLPKRVQFLQPPQPSWSEYGIGYRPLAQYSDNFGVGVGFQVRGSYIFGEHQTRAMVKLWPQVLSSSGEDPGLGLDQASDLSAFDGIDYEFSYANTVPLFGQGASAGFAARKHLGLLENSLFFSKTLSGYGDDVNRRFTVDLIHQYNPGDRAFGVGEIGPFAIEANPFIQEHMVSARLGYEASNGADRLALTAEAGGSLREGGGQSANRVYLEADKATPFSSRLQGMARLKAGVGTDRLVFFKQFRLGAPTIEDAWRNDAYRTLAAALEDPLANDDFTALEGAGPVAYLTGPAPPVGSSVVAGTLSLIYTPATRNDWLRPLSLEAFSGIGTTWNTVFEEVGYENGDLLADAGFGLAYDVSQVRALQRWTGQSDVLSGLKLVVKFPVYANQNGLTEEGDELAFRWFVGISTR